ncbi:DNA-binding response regulator [Kineosporia sp. NBRC 101677]|nr:DNA-binding response regulator [Kineosporia sp. NBRC 101677]
MRSTAPRTSVLIVGRYALLRDGLRAILTGHDDLRVVADAADCEAALDLAGRCHPDVILLDVEPPADEAEKDVLRLRAAAPSADVIVLAPNEDPTLIRAQLASGARGFLLKSIQRHDLLAAIRAVREDRQLLVLGVSEDSVRRIDVNPPLRFEAAARPRPTTERVAGLSARELEVLALVGQALSNGQIASRLALTEATVKRHLRNIFAKLGAVSRLDAVNKLAGAQPETPETPESREGQGMLWLGRWYRS